MRKLPWDSRWRRGPVTGTATQREGRVFHTLDALRGIAALGVVSFHMAQLFTPIATPGGYLAVDLFFMMSGVVISHAYEDRFRAGMGTFDFARARLIRLYPLYLLGTLFGIAVTVASLHGRNINHWDAPNLLRVGSLALLFLPNLSSTPINELFPLNIPCWSLFLEILVNILFVISWPLLTSRRLLVVTGICAAALVFAILNQGSLDQGSVAASFAVGLARAVFGFAVGVLIARIIVRARHGESNFAVLAIMAVVAIAIGGRPQGATRGIWDAVCVLAVFPLIVYYGTLISPGLRLRKIATFLGVTSYAVYVLHSPLSSILSSAARHFGRVGAPYSGIAVMLFLLGGCWLVDRYIDMPIRRQLSCIIPKAKAIQEGP